jgi:hypothetical protein
MFLRSCVRSPKAKSCPAWKKSPKNASMTWECAFAKRLKPAQTGTSQQDRVVIVIN